LPNANDPTVHARRDERPQGVIAYLTIDDGRGLNVMSSTVMDALAAALVALASDEDLRAVVLSGAGQKLSALAPTSRRWRRSKIRKRQKH
jgi:enoyl-CoA hydratase/carnithine racemase